MDWTLDATSVSVAFGPQTVLTDISIAVDSGTSTAIVGPSGSGKTTLLSVLGGLLTPTRGSIAATSSAGERSLPTSVVAWVLQANVAFGRRTTLENVLLGSLQSSESTQSRISSAVMALERVGLSEHLHKKARSLSGGEFQRMSIARALVRECPFIFADEPTAQLDRRTAGVVLDRLFESRRTGLVLATHDPLVIDRCDKIVDLSGGSGLDAV